MITSSASSIATALAKRCTQRLADGGYLVPCPVPSHGRGQGDRNPSLRIADGDKQILLHCFAGCDAGDVLDELRRRGLLEPRKEDVASLKPPLAPLLPRLKIDGRDHIVDAKVRASRARTDDDIERIKYARNIWNTAREPRGTLAELYLNLRHLALDVSLSGRVLRFHPQTPWRNETTGKTERVPALVAAFRSIDNNEITAIHRIALTPDGRKIGKRMLGVVRRAAIKLDIDVGDELAVSEGIENAMTARALGVRQVWAL
ncbi:MAG TPA: hypothetical protein VGJ20_23395, partial [Xanthobacteraceae bacterium]